jgi:hypothetical protein
MRRRLFEWVWIGIRVIMRRWWRRRMVVTWRRWLVSVKNVLDHDGRVDLGGIIVWMPVSWCMPVLIVGNSSRVVCR